MKVGYIRVSSVDQNTARQLDGIELARVYEEKVSGKDRDRPQLKECLRSLSRNDTLHINNMIAIATNNRDLFDFLRKIKEIGANIYFIEDDLLILKSEDLSLFSKLSDFESSAVKERQAIGRDRARKNGKQIGRFSLSDTKVEEIKRRNKQGDNAKDIAKK